MAVAFDPVALRRTGSPVPVQEDVSIKPASGVANVAAASDGTVVYVPGGVSRKLQHIVWVDRRGAQTRALEQALENPRHPRISPDGGRLAIAVGNEAEGQIWVHDLTGAARPGVPLTFENHNLFPIWSPDGKRILFLTRGRTSSLNAVAADNSSLEPETLATDAGLLMPMDWVPKTDLVLVGQIRAPKGTDLELFQMTDRTWREIWPRPPFGENDARVSPDGKWVAFVSNRTGRSEVWVRSFLDAGSLRPISKDGGSDPVWSPDGGELFYRNGSKMMTASVAAAPQMRGNPSVSCSRVVSILCRTHSMWRLTAASSWSQRVRPIRPPRSSWSAASCGRSETAPCDARRTLMPGERRDLISDLYHRALARAPEERGAFLIEACNEDEGLRQEVESLLEYEPASAGLLERPAVAVAAVATGTSSMIDRQVGPYTIVAPLGAGGMGEVNRARDSKLGRDVAIKILPAHFTADSERRAPSPCSRHSITRTSARSTGWKKQMVSARWCSNWSKARRSPLVSSAAGCRSRRRSLSPARSPRHWTRRKRKASSTGI